MLKANKKKKDAIFERQMLEADMKEQELLEELEEVELSSNQASTKSIVKRKKYNRKKNINLP